jgi:hypothetical protein
MLFIHRRRNVNEMVEIGAADHACRTVSVNVE